LPSDHYIKEDEKFRETLSRAVDLASDGYLVTLGMRATWASPEYGYISPSSNNLEWSTVKRFIEKPTSEIASQYVRDGYFWNGGIFVWKAKAFLEEVKRHAPELIPEGVFPSEIIGDLAFKKLDFPPQAAGNDKQNAGGHMGLPLQAYFDAVPSISIDYAVMEKSDRVAVIPTNVGWSDIGTWESLHRLWKNERIKINETVVDAMHRTLGFAGAEARK
jgi:mannose-1-phosphate guanylyltransferase